MEAIADYGLLSNCQGSALVSRNGSIDWACLPSFDSPAMFARILGEPGGYWSIRTREASTSTRARTSKTRWSSARSCGPPLVSVALTDFMPLHPDDRVNDIGRHSPAALYRIVEGVDGTVDVDVELVVRPEFGLVTPLVTEVAPGLWRTRGGPITVTVAADAPLEVDGARLRAMLTVPAGKRFGFALHVSDPWRDPVPMPSPAEVYDAFGISVAGWQSWAAKLSGYEGTHRALLRRSALVLRAR